jgi:hypothetical protein
VAFKTPQEVGELYDIGFETRDGSTIGVKNRNGETVQLSQVAFVCSTKQEQEEATELQRKAQVVQLGPTLMDREWEQWPGETQGAWSSGLGQRIQFGGQGSDPAAYWDGLGIIWPITDWLPQQPFIPPAYTDASQPTPGQPGYMGTVAGFLPGGGNGYAESFNTTGHVQLIYLNSAGRLFIKQDPIAVNAAIQDMEIAHGYIWLVGSDAGGQLSLFYVDAAGTSTKLATISAATAVAAPAAMSTGRVINRQYVATVHRFTPKANYSEDQITVWDVTAIGAVPSAAAFTVLQVPTGWTVEDTEFSGDDLVVSMTDGLDSVIAAWNIASQSWRTLTQISGATSVSMVPIVGGLFLLARNATSATQRALNIYLLQATSLQDYGPLIPQIGATPFPYVTAVSHPSAFGSYAVFAVAVQAVVGGTVTILVYAYDVLRGRIFKVTSLAGLAASYAQALDKVPIAAFASMARTSPAAYNCQWGVALNINTATAASPNSQEFDIGIQTTPGSAGALLQLPFDGTSGLVDFTSAVPKLFMEVVAKFPPLVANALSGVTLNVWLDQDPGSLNPAPDYTATINGGTSSGAIELVVPINKMAVKLVYEIITAGGVYSGATWINAPKIISVSVRSATGWAWHGFLAAVRSALCNNNDTEDYVFDRQGTDEVAAYNFMKLLWRLKGGRCKATLANGDKYDALIQMLRAKGPKPFGVSMIASRPGDAYENMIEIQIREDI